MQMYCRDNVNTHVIVLLKAKSFFVMNKACNTQRDSERVRNTSLRVVKSVAIRVRGFSKLQYFDIHDILRFLYSKKRRKLSVIPTRSRKKQCSIGCRFLTPNPHFNIIQKLHVLFHLMLDVSFPSKPVLYRLCLRNLRNLEAKWYRCNVLICCQSIPNWKYWY